MKKLKILYEDKQLLILEKTSGELTISTPKEKERTLYAEASAYVKKQYPKNKVFIVNRLDKETSGIVVFAKKEEIKRYLQINWDTCAQQREYIGVVEGKVEKDKATLQYFLKEDAYLKVHVAQKGKKAITKYEVMTKNKNYSLLKINILTGRKHQIRVSLSEINHPLTGDKKYGAKKNPIGRLALHATKLTLQVPYRKEPIQVESKPPKEFFELCKEKGV